MNGNCGSQNNVYIGARYVPKIVGEWSADVAYEPLTVVLYQGTSYTSITYVPKGIIPSENTQQYWALTGNYNAQVEMYRQEVYKLQQDVDYIKEHYTITVDTINDMIENRNLIDGNCVKTKGYYKKGDLGGSTYLITTIEDPNNYQVKLDNNLFATLIDNIDNALCYGLKNDGVFDNSSLFQELIDFKYQYGNNIIHLPKGNYLITTPLKVYYTRTPNFWGMNGTKIYGDGCGNTSIIKNGEGLIDNIDTVIYAKDWATDGAGSGIILSDLTINNKSTSPNSYCITGDKFSRSEFTRLELYGNYGIKTEGYSNVFNEIISFTENTCLEIKGGTSNNIIKFGCFTCHNPYIIGSSYTVIDNIFGDGCTGDFLTLNSFLGMSINSIGTESPLLDNVVKLTNPSNFGRNRHIHINNISMFNLTNTDANIIFVDNSNVSIDNITISYNAKPGENYNIVDFNNSLMGNVIIQNFGINQNSSSPDLSKITSYVNMSATNTFQLGSDIIEGSMYSAIGYNPATNEINKNFIKNKQSIITGLKINSQNEYARQDDTNASYATLPEIGSIITNTNGSFAVAGQIVIDKVGNVLNKGIMSSIPLFFISYATPPAQFEKNGALWFNLETNKLSVYANGWKTITTA